MNSKKSNASLKVEVTKCAGVFIANGTYEILADSQSKGWTGSYTLGTRSFSKEIVTLSKSLVGQHTYQVKLISSKPGSPIYTGSISVETRGRCWCTDYVKQRFNLRGAVPNGGAFGPYLINNGYRTLPSKESPIAGDVAVFPNDNHVAVYIKKTSTALWFRQGGKATDGWGEENSCYNVRDQDWKLNTYVVYYRR